MFKIRHALPLLLLGFIASAPVPTVVTRPAPNHVTGDYVEARTASVFAGACHYNGELVTSGHEAVMAWKITTGHWDGVDLAGVTAMACVSGDANLSDDTTARRSQVTVDAAATPVQAIAMINMLRARCGEHLGQITAVHQTPVSFAKEGREYDVKATGFGGLSVKPMPNDECCTQPSMVWYSPLIHLEHRKVGYTQTAGYTAGTNGDAWERSDENSAFYGNFTF